MGAGGPTGQEVPETVSPRVRLLANADAELLKLYRRARWLGSLGREPLVSFSSLFAAFLGGGAPVAAWVKATAEELGLAPQALLRQWSSSSSYPPAINVEHLRAPRDPELPENYITSSARQVLEAAASYQAQLGGAELGARHVFAAYLFSDLGHDMDFDAWGISPRAWMVRLVVWLGLTFPREASRWRSICTQRFRPGRSARLGVLLGAAKAIAEERKAPEVDVPDVVYAFMYCGKLWAGNKAASAWLWDQLGGSSSNLNSTLALPENSVPILRWEDSAFTSNQAVREWGEHAQLWALTCQADELNLRHALAALLSPRGPAAAKRMLRSVGYSPAKLAAQFAELMRAQQTNDDHATWDWLLQNDRPPRELRKPGYANDTARGVDVLSIDGDVRALASVLASTDTTPPLSVGLFGNWGSGKSFFMHKLREHIAMLAKQSCGAAQTAYCSQIAQIEFNAWHYIDGELWASLVSHVLDSLEGYFRGDEKSLVERNKLDLTTTQLQRAELDKQQQQLDARRAELAAKIRSYRPTGGEVAGAIAADISDEVKNKAAEANAEVRKALDDVARQIGLAPGELTLTAVREHTSALRAWLRRVTWQELMIGAAFLAIPAAIAVVAAALQETTVKYISEAASVVLPALGVAKGVIKVGRPIAEMAKQASAIGAYVTEGLARANPEVFREQKDLDTAQASLEAERTRLDARAEQLRHELDSSNKPGMREYVLERAMHYREKLGIVASVHRVFQNLSDQLRDDTTEPKLQRIILYIDDLDRCPPERVVEVLQAIHLLLSFELFVVVVAVDPKWLLRSLEAYYAKQFQRPDTVDDRESRPQFYLEKIFQIPYALQPMTPRRFDLMVAALLQPAVAAELPPGARDVPDASPMQVTAVHAVVAPSPDEPVAASAATAPPRIDLTPRNLEITSAELAHLRTLGPLVSSLRSAKRLANLYRIVRAGLDGDALDEFIDDRYQLTQLMLAAVVGCPDLASRWFKDILPRARGDAPTLLRSLEQVDDPRARFLHLRVRACREIASWDRVVEVCTLAARYSFETGGLLSLIPG